MELPGIEYTLLICQKQSLPVVLSTVNNIGRNGREGLNTAKLYVRYAAGKEKLDPPKENFLPLHGLHKGPGK